MIVTDEFPVLEKKELKLGVETDISLIIIYKSQTGIRLFISSHRRGDADIYLDHKEREQLIRILRSAMSRSLIEQKGFCGPLISPQAGDEPNSIVLAILQVIFVDKIIGMAIDIQGEHGVEAWLNLDNIQQIIEAIK